MAACWIVRIRHGAFAANCCPLLGTRRAFCQLPLVAEQRIEIGHVPRNRCCRPSAFDAAGCCVNTNAGFKAVLPTKTHLFNQCAFRLCAHQRRIAGAVCFTECVTTRNKCDSLFVIHAHTRKRIANVKSRGERIRITVRTFWVHINQAHLHSGKRVLKITFACVTGVWTTTFLKPDILGAPIYVFFGLPCIGTTTGKTVSFKAHRFHRDVTCQEEQVSP